MKLNFLKTAKTMPCVQTFHVTISRSPWIFEADIINFIVQMWGCASEAELPKVTQLQCSRKDSTNTGFAVAKPGALSPGSVLNLPLSTHFLWQFLEHSPQAETPYSASNLPARNKCLACPDAVPVPTHRSPCWSRRSHSASLTRCCLSS